VSARVIYLNQEFICSHTIGGVIPPEKFCSFLTVNFPSEVVYQEIYRPCAALMVDYNGHLFVVYL